MTNKKKSTPEGAPLTQDNGTTSDAVTQAVFLFGLIKTGSEHAMPRPDSRADRQLRKLIADANATGDCIINVGGGYFRPGDDDEAAFQEYIAKERHRARMILHKCRRMEEVFDRRYQ